MILGITGGCGFVGRATKDYIEFLAEVYMLPELNQGGQNHEVVVFDLMQGQDIRDYSQLEKWIVENKIERLAHLAAIARFADADANPKLAFETNVGGTINVVKVCAKYHIPLVYSSTGSSLMPLNDYEPPYKEDIPARGNSVYGVTKALGEYYVREHTPHIIMRYAHLFGIGKMGGRHGLVAGFYDRIKRGLEPILYNGLQSNDFMYEVDVARANYLALIAPWSSWNQTYHIGTGCELTAKEAGESICDVLGYKGNIEIKAARSVDADRFCFDVSKAKAMLDFEAEFTFRQGLEDMVAKGWGDGWSKL